MSDLLKVLVVDDEAPARDRLATMLKDIGAYCPNQLVASVGDGLAALKVLDEERADVILTDIRMPRMGGVELAMHLKLINAPPAVIFTTAYDHHAIEAFELNALDYLLKPIRAERLCSALSRLKQSANQVIVSTEKDKLTTIAPVRRFLSCTERGRLLVVPVSEIIYFRADSKYVIAKTIWREYVLEESLSKLEVEFGDLFLRLHRCVLVAKVAIRTLEQVTGKEGEHWTVAVKGLEERLPISRRQWPLVKLFVRH